MTDAAISLSSEPLDAAREVSSPDAVPQTAVTGHSLVLACLVMSTICAVRAVVYVVPTQYHAPSLHDRLFVVGLWCFAAAYGVALAWLSHRVCLGALVLGVLCYLPCTAFTCLWMAVVKAWPAILSAASDPEAPLKVLLDQPTALPIALSAAYFLAASRPGRESARALLDRGSKDLQIAPVFAAAIFLVPIAVLGTFLVWQFADLPSSQRFAAEDGIAEWGTAAGLLVAAILSAGLAARLFRRGSMPLAFVYLVLFVAGLAVAGEEVSWGSRYFDFGQELREHNTQGEVSMHNMRGVQERVPAVIGGFASAVTVVMVVLPLTNTRLSRSRTTYLVFPHYLFLPIFVVMSANHGRMGPLLWNVLPDKGNVNEIEELLVSLVFLAFVSLNHWYVSRKPAGTNVDQRVRTDDVARTGTPPQDGRSLRPSPPRRACCPAP